MILHKDRHNSRQGIKHSEINLDIYGQLIFEDLLRHFNREKIVITTNGVGTIGCHIQKMNLDPYFKLHININLKWIVELNVSAKMQKTLEENIGTDPCIAGLG